MLERIECLGKQLVNDGADIVVVACGGLGKFCGENQFHRFYVGDAIVPVVIPLPVALKHAEMMVDMNWAMGMPLPALAHSAQRLLPSDLLTIRKGFGLPLST